MPSAWRLVPGDWTTRPRQGAARSGWKGAWWSGSPLEDAREGLAIAAPIRDVQPSVAKR